MSKKKEDAGNGGSGSKVTSSQYVADLMAQASQDEAADKAFEAHWALPSIAEVQVETDLSVTFEAIGLYLVKATAPDYILSRWAFIVEQEKRAGRLPVSHPGNNPTIPSAERRDLIAELTSHVWRRVQPAFDRLEAIVGAHGQSPMIVPLILRLEDKVLPLSRELRSVEVSTIALFPVLANTEFRLRRALQRLRTEPRWAEPITTARLKWKSSINAFAFIFNELAKKGYFILPAQGGKKGDASVTGYARILLQAFELVGADGKPLSAERLRVPLSPSFHRPLAESKAAKFQLPSPGELIFPEAKDIEE